MRDPVSLIEAAYRVEGSNSEWLEGLARVAAASLGSNQGALAFQYDASSGDWVHILGAAFHGLSLEFGQQLFNQPDATPEEGAAFARLFASMRVASVREVFVPAAPAFGKVLDQFGVDDILGFNALDLTGRGCVVGIATASGTYSHRTAELYHRLSAHIAAGGRLRRTLEALTNDNLDPSSTAEAVITPDGRFEHAVGEAEPQAAREALRDALIRIDRARSRRESPMSSVELWRALISGRWSVVEHFERDGKRYYLAHKNDPELAADRALTSRERQVFGYAELGHSDKLIAYSLGLKLSTVSTLLSNARRKLGASVELMRSSGEAEGGTGERDVQS